MQMRWVIFGPRKGEETPTFCLWVMPLRCANYATNQMQQVNCLSLTKCMKLFKTDIYFGNNGNPAKVSSIKKFLNAN